MLLVFDFCKKIVNFAIVLDEIICKIIKIRALKKAKDPILSEIPPEHEDYSMLVHKPINQLMALIPLLVFYHMGTLIVKDGLAVPHSLGIIVRCFGGSSKFLIGFFVVIVLLAQQMVRKENSTISFWGLLAIVIEGAVLTLPVIVISWLVGSRWMIPSAVENAGGIAESEVFRGILISVGAGIYEEFVFRLVLISGGSLLLMDVFGIDKHKSGVILIIISAITFSACHFPMSHLTNLQVLDTYRFFFYALAGAWWGILYIWRGFGVAVYSHMYWDLICAYHAANFAVEAAAA